MKKIYLLFICFIVVAQTISAQNDKKLLKMTFGKSYFELKYLKFPTPSISWVFQPN